MTNNHHSESLTALDAFTRAHWIHFITNNDIIVLWDSALSRLFSSTNLSSVVIVIFYFI
jgi:hypothetical protein